MIFTHDISPILVELGPLAIRWYSLLFALGIIANYLILKWIFKRDKYPVEHVESVVVYLFFGLLIGARLGEVLFYEPGYFFSNPVEIFKIWNGGLSSHGAAIGLFIAFVIFNKVHKLPFGKYVDVIVIPMPLTAAMVRLGNFFNSEIVGHPTDGSFGVVFKRLGEDFPRHPAQLYEGLLSLAVFVVLVLVYKNYYKKAPQYFFLFLYLLLYFGGRFFTEFWKDVNSLPESFQITTGQLLSLLPVVLATSYFTMLQIKKSKNK